MSKSSDKWVWDQYWRFDRLASCFDTEGSNYPEDFINEWAAFFGTLPSGAKILDLCTGNGAIARMAAEFAETKGKDFKITGIDLADIDPKKFAAPTPGQKRISFLGGVSADALPFDKGAFDAVISQYGFEYTDYEKTVPEIARVLKPKSKAEFLCHSEDTVQAVNAKAELELLDYTLDKLNLHELAGTATEAVWQAEQAGDDPGTAHELMKKFEAAINALAKKARQGPENPFAVSTIGLLKHTFEVRRHFPLEVLLQKIEDARLEAMAHRGRVRELFDAAVGKDDETAIIQAFKTAGFQAKPVRNFHIENGQKLAGRIFEFERLA